MRRRLVWLIIFLEVIVFTGCNLDDDGYSLNDAWISFGFVREAESASMGIVIKQDDGDYLYPIATLVPVIGMKDSTRVLVNYTILDDVSTSEDYNKYLVRINSWRDILYKGILDIIPENADSIGNDPIEVIDVWTTDDLLTFKLKYWGNNKTHFINLVKQPGEITEDSQPVTLQLRHNTNDDDDNYLFTAYVSFNMKSIQISGTDSVQYKVTAEEYNGEQFLFEETYYYDTGEQ